MLYHTAGRGRLQSPPTSVASAHVPPPPTARVGVLTSSTREGSCVWSSGLSRGDHGEMRSLGGGACLMSLFVRLTGFSRQEDWRGSPFPPPANAGKDGRRKEKGAAEDEMVGWYHRLNGHELRQTPGDRGGQGSLACCSPRGRRESVTEQQTVQCDWCPHHTRKSGHTHTHGGATL